MYTQNAAENVTNNGNVNIGTKNVYPKKYAKM